MRIAYLSIGGHIHTERWLRHFVRRGHDVHLMTVQPVPIEGITVHDIRTGIPLKPLHYAVALGRVRRVLAAIQPDLLHTHFLTGYGYWGAFSGFHPFILTVWGDDVYLTPHQSFMKGVLARHVLARADLVTGDSEDIIAHAVAMGARREVCHVVQWGVNTADFRPGVPSTIRRRLRIPADAPVVTSVRSFTQPYYNIDVIVGVVPAVLARHPETHFIFAGNEGDDSAFRALAASLGIGEEAHFVGRIPHEELPQYLAASDAFVSVPSVDATAVSLLEAMAVGTPVIVSNLASALEWVEDGQSGLVVPPGEKAPLEEAIVRLIESPELRRRLGARSAEIVRARADHETHMTRMESLCQELVATWRGRGGHS